MHLAQWRVVGLPAVIAVTIALYLPTLSHPFVYQDAHYAYTVAPAVVHGVSLGLHLLNGLMLAVLLSPWTGAVWAVGLFLVHPVNVEAVAYGAAQSELIILGGLLLLALCVKYRLWLAAGLPILALSATKLKAIPSFWTEPGVSDGVAMGVSYLQWWRWEAVAAWRLLRLWLVPVGLTIDHDAVHVATWVQWLALASLPASLLGVAWRWPASRLPVLVIACLWLPRFAIRVPLSTLNEHHFYPATTALAVLMVSALKGRQ